MVQAVAKQAEALRVGHLDEFTRWAALLAEGAAAVALAGQA